jgi:hypothetical protein
MSGIVPRQLAIIRGAIAELARLGLTVDALSIDSEKVVEFDNLGITARHIGASKEMDLLITADAFPPRTIAGIPLNVRPR